MKQKLRNPMGTDPIMKKGGVHSDLTKQEQQALDRCFDELLEDDPLSDTDLETLDHIKRTKKFKGI